MTTTIEHPPLTPEADSPEMNPYYGRTMNELVYTMADAATRYDRLSTAIVHETMDAYIDKTPSSEAYKQDYKDRLLQEAADTTQRLMEDPGEFMHEAATAALKGEPTKEDERLVTGIAAILQQHETDTGEVRYSLAGAEVAAYQAEMVQGRAAEISAKRAQPTTAPEEDSTADNNDLTKEYILGMGAAAEARHDSDEARAEKTRKIFSRVTRRGAKGEQVAEETEEGDRKDDTKDLTKEYILGMGAAAEARHNRDQARAEKIRKVIGRVTRRGTAGEQEANETEEAATPQNWRQRFSDKFKGLKVKYDEKVTQATVRSGFLTQVNNYYEDPEKGERRKVVAYAGAIGVAAVGMAATLWASSKGWELSIGDSADGANSLDGGFGGDNGGKVQGETVPKDVPETKPEDKPEGTVVPEDKPEADTDTHPLAEKDVRTVELEAGDNIWNNSEAFLESHGYETNLHNIDLVKDAVLEKQGLSEADARRLPVGYTFTIPLEVLEQLDKLEDNKK